MSSSDTPTPAVAPAWVLVAGQLRCVSDFAHLIPNLRPSSLCPLCLGPVVLKLGDINVHHYAHQHESACLASHPESALHLNTKFHFAHQLQTATKRQLFVEQRCKRCQTQRQRLVWLHDWDEVRVEYSLQSARPDIALLREGRVIAALEILVTHAVDESKATLFQEQNIQWLEIPAAPELYTPPTQWTVQDPLPIAQSKVPYPVWVCPSCQQRIELERQAQEHAEANWVEVIIHAALMVDLYYPSGKKYRQVFYVKKLVQGGVWVKAWIEDDKKRTLDSISGSRQHPLTNPVLHRLKAHVEAHLENHRQQGHLVDVVVPWRLWQPGRRFVARDFDRHPLNYHWDSHNRQWVKDFWQESHQQQRQSAPASQPTTQQWHEMKQVVEAALAHADERERVALVRSLARFPPVNVAKELRRFFQDQSQAVREAALEIHRSLPPY